MFRIMKKNVIPWLVSHLAAVMVIFLLPGGCLKEEVPYLTLSEEGDIEMEYDGGLFLSRSRPIRCGLQPRMPAGVSSAAEKVHIKGNLF